MAACLACPAGKAANILGQTSLAQCSTCNNGRYAPTPGSSECMLCPAGRYGTTVAPATECAPCPTGKFSTVVGANSAATCLACPNQQTTLQPGASQLSDCRFCPLGQARFPGGNECAECPPGTYLHLDGKLLGSYASNAEIVQDTQYLMQLRRSSQAELFQPVGPVRETLWRGKARRHVLSVPKEPLHILDGSFA